RSEGGNPVVVAHDLVGNSAGLDVSRPSNQAGHAKGALPVGVLLGAEPGHGAVRPGIHVRSIVARINHDGVVGDSHIVERLEQGADHIVVFLHAVDVLAVAVGVTATMTGADVR